FKPIKVLKNQFQGGRTSGVSKGLLSFQFVISITLITSTLVIFNQLEYIKNKELGYQGENIITIPLSSLEAKKSFQQLKSAVNSLPEVKGIGASSQLPGDGYTSNGYFVEGTDVPYMFNALHIDPDYLETMSVNILEGRNFSELISSDSSAYLVNQALVDKMGWSQPIGKIIRRGGKHEVIGVVEDYHFATLHEAINPLVITMAPFIGFDYLSVKVEGGNLSSTLERIEQQWNSVLPEQAFVYNFLDQTLDVLYHKEEAFKSLFTFFSLLAIVIAVLGLFGLVSYSVERRTKEVGIRKVLGASVNSILYLLSREFLTLLLLATLLGWPLAYFGMDLWLNSFSYRVSFPYITLLLGSSLLFALTVLVVVSRALNSALANPVEYIKND
ncbi:MAG: FtsX-like permease family protein, partial [Bacteroidota bacterium]